MAETPKDYWNVYNKYNSHNELGMDIAADVSRAVNEVMNKFAECNPRDIGALFVDIANAESLNRVMVMANRMHKKAKAEASSSSAPSLTPEEQQLVDLYSGVDS